ncbi:MAG TPA: Gfo/Idh/MocA family oxidoreductase [Steroidobacteraceae bacterium]|jgi:D-galactose 1-dehydrogenase|nr:Gfo/Idh/MocA family oxidoreductase [Steroidobacteraceae bacterium]
MPIRIALVGVGKIARDQHLPALAANPSYELIAAASPQHALEGVAHFMSIEELLDAVPEVDAVSICTPPQVRYAIARHALTRGRHVMLEKPPGATLNEVSALVDLARERNLALFASWHSRAADGVEPARQWLASRHIRSVTVTWKEDVRVWHPGQDWIWQAGGLGVFDPGINALSIITRVLPGTLVLEDAQLAVPSNCETPIAATLRLKNEHGVPVQMELDFLQTGPQTWDIDVETDGGRLQLANGGRFMRVDGELVVDGRDNEYPNLYSHFATLVHERRCDVDLAPFRLVADAFMVGRRVTVAPFDE